MSNILERPKWELSRCILHPDNLDFDDLKVVLHESDQIYIQAVRKYLSERYINHDIAEERALSMHLVVHPIRAKLFSILADYEMRKPLFFSICMKKKEQAHEWKEIFWDIGQISEQPVKTDKSEL
jgi:hypothetical protein